MRTRRACHGVLIGGTAAAVIGGVAVGRAGGSGEEEVGEALDKAGPSSGDRVGEGPSGDGPSGDGPGDGETAGDTPGDTPGDGVRERRKAVGNIGCDGLFVTLRGAVLESVFVRAS